MDEHRMARGMLAAFASVGADRFDLTWTDAVGDKVGFRGNYSLRELDGVISGFLEAAARQHHNVIVRPKGSGPVLIQLDDLDGVGEAQLRPLSFLTLRTSPGSYQAWIAVTDADADFARRLRKGAGADPSASGATRMSGSRNFKEKYAPAFPVVETIHANPGQVVTCQALQALGVVSSPEPPAVASATTARRHFGQCWPSYERCVDGAPRARDSDRPDISRADFTFCLLAIDWGRGVEEAAKRLMLESRKAQENGESYALRTAQNAAAAVARRRQHGRS